MGTLTFLKKLGQILVQGVGVVTGLYPLLQPFLGSGKGNTVAVTAVNDLTQIAQLVIQIETAFNNVPNSTGAQKLQALVPLVQSIITTSQVVSGKKVDNSTLFTQGCTEVAQGMVDILNSIHPDEAAHA